MKWGSLRLKLTLWNVAVLACALVGFGLALTFADAQLVKRDIERELRNRAAHLPPHRPGEPPPPQPLLPDTSDDPFRFARRPEVFDASGQMRDENGGRPVFDPVSLQQSLKGEERFSDRQIGGEHFRVLSTPLYRGGRFDGAIQVAREMRDYDALAASQVTTLWLLLPVALLVAGLGAMFLVERALKPVGDITAAAAQIGAEDLSRRLEVNGEDELAQLARTFNGMIARLDASFTNLNDAYETQKRFSADASHELRTPLTRLMLATSSGLAQGGDVETLREALKIADDAGNVMSKLVQELLTLSRADIGNMNLKSAPFDVRIAVSDAVRGVPCKGGPKVDVVLPDEPVTVLSDQDQIKRVVMNLVENACRHTPSTGSITVTISATDEAVVEVKDTGDGISPEHLPHVFERFYRVDAARTREDGGAGLGLPICESIVRAHGGRSWIESEVGTGTTVRFSLPLSEKPKNT